jgi:hypothetical protein
LVQVQQLSRARALTILALTSSVLVALEVLITRLLSVVTWYGLAFLVLSIAMLGLTAGSLHAYEARDRGEPMAPWVAHRLELLALSILGAVGITVTVPLVSDISVTALTAILVVAGAIAVPMTMGGGVVARIMAESDAPVGVVYAVDLGAAALGALLPLLLLGPLDGPTAVIALGVPAAVAAAVARPSGSTRWGAVGLAGMLLFLVATNNGSASGLRVRFVKTAYMPPSHAPYYEGWNALSNIYVYPPGMLDGPHVLWAPSPRTPKADVRVATAQIDGEASTRAHMYSGDVRELDVLRYDATNVAHWIRPGGLACVIGVGGGRDLESALIFGHPQVLGVEINPLLVRMLHTIHRDSPIADDPRVTLVTGDGRSLLTQMAPQCSTLQASLIDTWAATGAGAFAHTEATLYTREAWALLMKRVEPSGVLTFSRWYSPTRVSETARLVSLAMTSLLDRGAANPPDHFAVITSGALATLVLSPAPLAAEDVTLLHARAAELDFNVLFAPDQPPADPILRALLSKRAVRDLGAAGEAENLDTSPPTDDRPFFFQLLLPRAWLHPLDLSSQAMFNSGVIGGNIFATVELLFTFVAVGAIALVLLGPALYRAARTRKALPGARPAVYFSMLGAGFMLVEIALVQRMHVVLGHPTYALIVVLAGLLLATGIGSFLSSIFVKTRRQVSVIALMAAVILALLPHAVIQPLAHATLAAGLGVRVLWTGAVAAFVGLFLGMLFPSAVKYLARDRGVPVALALNGTASVLGTVLAVVVSVAFGISVSLTVAACAYAIAACVGPHGWSRAA